MATKTLVTVEEYLTTVYRPDCDYVDGEVLERNFGEREHSYIQAALGSYFFARRKDWSIEVYPEQRVQARPNRFRIPDLCVVLGGTKEKILTTPPFLCVEILSPEDRMSRVQDVVFQNARRLKGPPESAVTLPIAVPAGPAVVRSRHPTARVPEPRALP